MFPLKISYFKKILVQSFYILKYSLLIKPLKIEEIENEDKRIITLVIN